MNSATLKRKEVRTIDPDLLLTLAKFCEQRSEEEETRTPTSQLTLPPQSSASTNSATSPLLLCSKLSKHSAQNRTRTCTSLNTRT